MTKMNVKAVVFPDNWPVEDQQIIWLALANPDSSMASIVLNKCYIFARDMVGDEIDFDLLDVQQAPVILEARNR